MDSWAIEILHPTNAAYASSCQSVGIRIGGMLATTLFVALNSVEFCNTWIYKDKPREEPYMSLSDFILYWAIG